MHLAASVSSGHASAGDGTGPVGSAARGDRSTTLGAIGALLRTAFLADYFVNEALPPRELRRVLPTAARRSLQN